MARKFSTAAKVDVGSPILNGPYDPPAYHYATSSDGQLNYNDPRPGRRIFSPQTPQVPIGQQAQGSLYDLNDHAAQYRNHLVNLLREQIAIWRQSQYTIRRLW